MTFISDQLSQYCENHTSDESSLLAELHRDTFTNVLAPRMLSGHLQGKLLSFFSKMIQPSAILEIGTYTGYSALCLAEGLKSNGILHTIDINEELETRIRKFLNASSHAENITLHIGNALQIIPTLVETFELVFLDADKENYSAYYDLIIDKLPHGAIIIADNVLWSGKILDHKELAKDNDTKELDAFNKKVHDDPRVENILLPIRDGLMVVRKL